MSLKALSAVPLLVLAGPLAAQDLAIPDDWTWHADGAAKVVSGQDVEGGEFRFVRMPPGWHVTTTTAGVVMHPRSHTVQGRYAVEVEAHWFGNREGGEWTMPADAPWGISLDHPDAPADNPRRMEFLIRRDGMVSIQATDGDQVIPVAEWTADTAVKRHNGNGIVTYVLRMEYVAERVRFSVNGKEILNVEVGPAPYAVIPGLHVGPGLNLHVSRFDLITPLAPPRPAREG